jgi:RHH-type proline utilization regulon transcriptional repressor/proline dehydrogenase/delta 1-pyrroline-5-carboxylate dehydrogenase
VAPKIAERYLMDESAAVHELCERAQLERKVTQEILSVAQSLTTAMRERSATGGGLDSFMVEYDLSSREGVVLMCLAEALLRIPDSATADRLIADKLGDADFHQHLGRSSDLLVNVSTWGLLLSGQIVSDVVPDDSALSAVWSRLLARVGEPLIRTVLRNAMRIMSEHFVMGQTIENALSRASKMDAYCYSFDMLGEAALTSAHADAYFEKYAHAIEAISQAIHAGDFRDGHPGISVKLSALSPRFEHRHIDSLQRDLIPRLNALAAQAIQSRIPITIDAEESERLDVTLFVFEAVCRALADTIDGNLGLAVQAYQKRSIAVVEWLDRLARELGARIPVRLVKGAYWDSEIKLAQVRGLASFPVFTRKTSTDVSYLACARALLESGDHLFPQFATHNPHTVAWVIHHGEGADFEFQRLHGMGEALYESVEAVCDSRIPCRVYAPVGLHQDLLPYLVRRLLENGANTSFVNRFIHAEIEVQDLIQDPVELTRSVGKEVPNPRISLPPELFGAARKNSYGVNLTDPLELSRLAAQLAQSQQAGPQAVPIVAGREQPGERVEIRDPGDLDAGVGIAQYATRATMRQALDVASAGFPAWSATSAARRAQLLRSAADLFERSRAELAATCVAEAGRTLADALAEVREAVDFLRFYANQAEHCFGNAQPLAGPTGESNALRMLGRGVFVCISPWNFPIAIFTGQVAAALGAGNTVIAKPAEQTPLTAVKVVRLLLEAGVPADVLQFLPGSGRKVGETLLPDPRVSGVAFTGSNETAKTIERTLAQRDGPIAALIAETGGVNAMIVDSSALAEQVVRDAAASAFNSAGQRCSALRLLCVQSDVAEAVIAMLIGRMRELVIGDPAQIATDIGPVISPMAVESLQAHVDAWEDRVLFRCRLDKRHDAGSFFPPTLIELDEVAQLTQEVFGPVLHVVRFEFDEIDEVLDQLNGIGYGLTLGVQSRVASFASYIEARARVGNIYVNRDMIGAVVGVQPFGGLGLSGTGPKAGGPHYLARFGVEQTISVNTAAVGGNIDLLAMDDQ